MELIEVKQALNTLKEKLDEITKSFNIDKITKTITTYEEEMSSPDFWSDRREAKNVIDEANLLKSKKERYDELVTLYEELEVTYSLLNDEEMDETLKKELVDGTEEFKQKIHEFDLQLLLTEPYDQNNAIVELHPGAGGTESQDWGEMLLRMYTRYAEKKGYKVEILDYQNGDEAGIKSVTLILKGENAYGYIKSEKGVHRLVRISPFDSSGRRHTSFVSVDVMPEINDDIEIEVKSEDIKVDTYRASGAGGQHVNTTDSAVRITHTPTGTVVTCQNERSQIKNRERAMQMLKTKLYQVEVEKKQEEIANLRGEQKEIGWGSQIRSYVFHPYSMVKDHRTHLDVGNTQAVMDGDLDQFIDAYLRWRLENS
ncbi:peptide chain release factor 2 [Haloplasma contractile]|uniref:Peptide chain release factor 2 n=1 Tax=Haloplasma contractile SSD-17B TaxID=1033810 RepID=U2E8B2_9MOLU|nr:peptide chain release factor 2 [Haloplasma contractile]ERJ11423.1 Peptide chain release factor 2 protein [Haloplasma contractile SSD-17B]